MRILVVSDTHGKHTNLKRALQESGEIDMLIHLGDVEGGAYEIERLVDCEKHIVRGNNDYFTDLPQEEEFYIGDKKVFITHGHFYMVSWSKEEIKKAARERNADIVMFGHTHYPYAEEDGDLLLLNPGSLAYPRQEGRKGSYIILEMDEAGKITWQQHYLEML